MSIGTTAGGKESYTKNYRQLANMRDLPLQHKLGIDRKENRSKDIEAPYLHLNTSRLNPVLSILIPGLGLAMIEPLMKCIITIAYLKSYSSPVFLRCNVGYLRRDDHTSRSL